MLCIFTAISIGLSSYRTLEPLPGGIVPDGWGVNIHFTRPLPNEMSKLSSTFRFVRMDFFWNEIERVKRVYDFSAYDTLLASLQSHGVRPIFILDYGNDLYQKGSPRSPDAIAGFVDFVRASVAHFRGRGVIWEMWNEPNIGFWSPRPDVSQYIALATAVGKAIRKTARDEWFIGPACSTFDWRFIKSCFKAGLLKYWDAVSVHPYRGDAPETAGSDWSRLAALVRKYEPHGKHVRLISGEWGYSTAVGGISETLQSEYVVRQYLSNLQQGVNLSIWYDWKDDGPDPKNFEHRFGTRRQNLTPKPSFLAARKIADALRGFRFELTLYTPNPADHIMVFGRGGKVKIAAWTTGGAHEVSTPLGSLALTPMPRVSVAKTGASDATLMARMRPLPPLFTLNSRVDARELSGRIYEEITALRFQSANPGRVSLSVTQPSGASSPLPLSKSQNPSAALDRLVPMVRNSPETLDVDIRFRDGLKIAQVIRLSNSGDSG